MDEKDWLADRFERSRGAVWAVAYRMLGSLTEADDAVQDTWVRVSRAEMNEVENFGGWLTTIVAHVFLNMLRLAKCPARGTPRGTSTLIQSSAQWENLDQRARCSLRLSWPGSPGLTRCSGSRRATGFRPP